MGRVIKIVILCIILYFVAIVFVQLTFLVGTTPMSDIYQKGNIIMLGNRAWVLAHGNYQTKHHDTYYCRYHETTIDNQSYVTHELLEGLHWLGAEHVWIGMCEQGNENYSIKCWDYNWTELYSYPWADYVDRVEEPGLVYPVFTGFSLERVVFDE